MPLTIDSLDAVRHRFSRAGSARKWHWMYDAETERLDEANYRLRRDIAVSETMARTNPGSKVLDLGCGAAPVLSELRRRGLDVSGVDCAADMLEYARRRLRRMGLDEAGLFLGDCRETPFGDASMDVVVCLGVISYVEDYGRILDEVDRVLKPGGTLILSYRNKFRPILSDPVALLKWMAKAVLRPLRGSDREESFVIGQFLDHRTVNAAVERLGFRFVRFLGIGFGPFCFAGRPLFPEKRSMRISRRLDRLFSGLNWDRPQRWLADVSLWVYEKPAAPSCPQASGSHSP